MPQGSSGFVNPTFLNCKCNTVSASTPARNPYFNNPIRYSENGLHGIPCIDNQTRTLGNVRHAAGAPRKVAKTNPLSCPQTPPLDSRPPCTTSNSCTNTTLASSETNLGSMIYFDGSSVKKGALAGTLAAIDHVAILSATQCGEADCPGGTCDGELRRFNKETGTWDRVVIQFQTEQDDTAILGNGIDEPFHLDLEYLAQNLCSVIGKLRLESAGFDCGCPDPI